MDRRGPCRIWWQRLSWLIGHHTKKRRQLFRALFQGEPGGKGQTWVLSPSIKTSTLNYLKYLKPKAIWEGSFSCVQITAPHSSADHLGPSPQGLLLWEVQPARQRTAWLPSSCRVREGCPPSCHPRSREECALMRYLHDSTQTHPGGWDITAGSTAFSCTRSQCGHLPSSPPNAVPVQFLDLWPVTLPSCCSFWREEVYARRACLLQGCGKPWLWKNPLSLKQHQLAC